jgi:cytochrome P450
MTPTIDSVMIEDPAFYDNPFETYARLRATDRVYCREDLRLWLLTGYDEVVAVSKQARLFSCREGILLADFIEGKSFADEYFAGPELIVTTDPPRHNELRRLISPAFTPRRVAQLEDDVRQTARALVGRLPAREQVDFISMAAEILPLVVISKLLGITSDDVSGMARWSDELLKLGQDMTEAERQESVRVFTQMNGFMKAQFAEKRARPAADLLSMLVSVELDNEKISDDNILMWASLVLAGGNETTRALMGNMVYALGTHQDQLKLLAGNRGLTGQMVEETLRWRGVVNGFGRRVTEDTQLGGKMIPAGDAVYMLYPAANRDPEVFANPEAYDITAERDREHVAFGVGQHFCPGNLLARLEARVLMEELVDRFPRWEVVTGAPIVSTLRVGFSDLQVIFREA